VPVNLPYSAGGTVLRCDLSGLFGGNSSTSAHCSYRPAVMGTLREFPKGELQGRGRGDRGRPVGHVRETHWLWMVLSESVGTKRSVA